MTTNRLVNTALLALMLALFTLGQLLDGPSDHSAEMAQSADLVQAQQAQRMAASRDFAAARQCRREYGEADYRWTASGQLVCVPRKGKAVVQTALQTAQASEVQP